MPNCTDYDLSVAEAKKLLGAVLLPHEFRMMVLEKYFATHGTRALANLCSQLIGLSNSVVANNREMIEIILTVEGDMHPHSAEKANLPTLFGALNGIVIAQGVDQKKTCAGCAYRIGTPANQSPATTCDADWCDKGGDEDFLCHMNLDDKGEPRGLCAGHAQKVRNA